MTQSQPIEAIEAAYAACRAIAKREAKNFYYSFVALPAPKRDAMCAIYAFMRHADDISDDESKDHATRREELARWTAAWREGTDTADPVFIAVRDTQQRFNIPDELLQQLIHGIAMDVQPEAVRRDADGLTTFPTFAELYQYCYYVASVVGLVSIRIFGYSSPAAEKLAEETGVAFQLTNILRDVREDAERGRMYIPADDLEGRGTSARELASVKTGRELTEPQRLVLAGIARRARAYYQSADRLLPLIAADSRPALRVLVQIYSRLLTKIEAQRFDVFTTRVQVPGWQKLLILSSGMLRMLPLRLRGGMR
ncbi:MAG TPA: phytoene/squalene synthase family protein [Acidobacteriaceae bacterium]